MKERDHVEKIVKDIIRRKDPKGYYIIPAEKGVLKFIKDKDILIENLGTYVILRTKSRRVAERLARMFAEKDLIKF